MVLIKDSILPQFKSLKFYIKINLYRKVIHHCVVIVSIVVAYVYIEHIPYFDKVPG